MDSVYLAVPKLPCVLKDYPLQSSCFCLSHIVSSSRNARHCTAYLHMWFDMSSPENQVDCIPSKKLTAHSVHCSSIIWLKVYVFRLRFFLSFATGRSHEPLCESSEIFIWQGKHFLSQLTFSLPFRSFSHQKRKQLSKDIRDGITLRFHDSEQFEFPMTFVSILTMTSLGR